MNRFEKLFGNSLQKPTQKDINEVMAAWKKNKFVLSVKLVRGISGCSLMDSKKFVDSFSQGSVRERIYYYTKFQQEFEEFAGIVADEKYKEAITIFEDIFKKNGVGAALKFLVDNNYANHHIEKMSEISNEA